MNASKINEYIFLEEKKMSEKIMDMEDFKTNKKKFNKNKKRLNHYKRKIFGKIKNFKKAKEWSEYFFVKEDINGKEYVKRDKWCTNFHKFIKKNERKKERLNIKKLDNKMLKEEIY